MKGWLPEGRRPTLKNIPINLKSHDNYWQLQQQKETKQLEKWLMTRTDTHTKKSDIQEGIEKRERVDVGGRGGFI